jgi:hypothetical protein
MVLVAEGPHDDDALGRLVLRDVCVEGLANFGRELCDERALVPDKPAGTSIGGSCRA